MQVEGGAIGAGGAALAVTGPQVELMEAKRILIVEDDRDAAATFSEALTGSGHKVRTAGSAGEAILQAQSFHPDLCVIDIGLPDGNGIRLARTLGLVHDCPTILVTGMQSYAESTPRHDAYTKIVLFKPVSPRDLLWAVEDALNVHA
jgi:DNA-binding response OmpR family regulator